VKLNSYDILFSPRFFLAKIAHYSSRTRRLGEENIIIMHTSSSTMSRSRQRCSRPALVNRTNSDDLNDLALAAASVTAGKCNNKKTTTSPRRSLKGIKKQTREQQHHQEAAAAASQEDTLNGGTRPKVADIHNSDIIVGSSSNSEKQQQLLVVTTKNQQQTSTSTTPTVSSYGDASHSSDDDSDCSDSTRNVTNTSRSSNNNNAKNKIITWQHGWLKDSGLTKTNVYYRQHLHRPISLLQAAVRGRFLTRQHLRQARIQQLHDKIGQLQNVAARCIQTQLFRRWQERQSRPLHVAARCIQARFRAVQAKQTRAITSLQAMARGWMARLQYQVRVLEQQLAHIRERRELELRRLRQNQTREMQRVNAEYQVLADEAGQRQRQILQATIQEIYTMRRHNRHLRHENETLQKASLVLRAKNEQTEQVTTIHAQNLQQLQEHVVPQLQRDYAQIVAVQNDYAERVQRYEQALALQHEHLAFERNVTRCLQQTIHGLLQHIDERLCTTTSDDVSLKRAILHEARETLHGVVTTNSIPNTTTTTTEKASDSNTSKKATTTIQR
jgi:hypothetical protein